MSGHRQLGADLGARMHHALGAELTTPSHPVVLIGSDCPGYDRCFLNQAFLVLADKDAVLGPALDGGCVLIGVKWLDARLFADIPWSYRRRTQVDPSPTARAWLELERAYALAGYRPPGRSGQFPQFIAGAELMSKSRLVFVYNADTGLFNVLSDFGHKILSPAAYLPVSAMRPDLRLLHRTQTVAGLYRWPGPGLQLSAPQ